MFGRLRNRSLHEHSDDYIMNGIFISGWTTPLRPVLYYNGIVQHILGLICMFQISFQILTLIIPDHSSMVFQFRLELRWAVFRKPYTKRVGSVSGGLHCKIRSLVFYSSVHLSESHHLLLRNPQKAVKPVTVFYTQPISAPFLWATASWMAVINWVGLLAVFTSVHWGTSTRLTLGRTSNHRGKFVWSMTSSTKCLLCCSSLCTTLFS